MSLIQAPVQIKTEFQCPYCGGSFDTEISFSSHLRMKACNPRIHRIDEIEIEHTEMQLAPRAQPVPPPPATIAITTAGAGFTATTAAANTMAITSNTTTMANMKTVANMTMTNTATGAITVALDNQRQSTTLAFMEPKLELFNLPGISVGQPLPVGPTPDLPSPLLPLPTTSTVIDPTTLIKDEHTSLASLAELMQGDNLPNHLQPTLVEPQEDDKPKPPKMWSCSDCPRKFTSQGSLYHHKWSHTGKTFSCRTCKKKLTNPYQVARHERICSIGRHRCQKCLRIFDEKEDLIAHEDSCDGRQEFPCPHCTKSYSAKYLLNKHLELHSDQTFPCGICAKIYESSTRLQQHMRSHTKPVVCPICSKRFAFTQLLKYHLRVHKKEKPFECDLCGRRFTRKNNLKNHRRTHTGERPFKCEFCLRTFAADSTYYIHRKLHLDKRDYKCYVCDKGFTKKSFLESHMASHNKERYKCETCNKSFKHKRSFDTHVKSHLDMDKMIQCNVCFELFSEKIMFDEHMKGHFQEHEKMKQEAAIGLVKMEQQTPVVKIEGQSSRDSIVKQELIAPLPFALPHHTRPVHNLLRPGPVKRIKLESKPQQSQQFLCDVCAEVFSTPAHLLKHVKLHVTVGIKAE